MQHSATDGEIKLAYRRLALKLHPDVNKEPAAQVRQHGVHGHALCDDTIAAQT